MSPRESWQKMDKAERLRHQLEVQSRQIERVFSTHQVSARVAGGRVETQSIRFDLSSHLETGLHKLRDLKHDLLAALGVTDVSLRKNEMGQWRLDIVRPHEAPVTLLDMMQLLPDLPVNTAVLGLDEEGSPLLLPFGDPDISHVLVAGVESAGKTSLLRAMAVSLAIGNRQSDLQLVVIDPNRPARQNRQLAPLMLLPHLVGQVFYDLEEAGLTVQALAEEMYHRINTETIKPTIVTLIDNAEALITNTGSEVLAALVELLQRGAEAGIYLVISMSEPQADWLGGLMQANLPIRLVGRVLNETDSVAATNSADAMADSLLGEGDFLAICGGELVHFQAAYIGNYDLHLTLTTLHRNRPQPLLAQPFGSITSEPSPSQTNSLVWQRSEDARLMQESEADSDESIEDEMMEA